MSRSWIVGSVICSLEAIGGSSEKSGWDTGAACGINGFEILLRTISLDGH